MSDEINQPFPTVSMADLHAEEGALIEEIISLLETKPRRTTVVLGALRALFYGHAVQLPPDGIAMSAMVAGELSGELLRASTTPSKPGASAAIH